MAVAMFGIHLGNSFACIALSKDDDRVEVLANDTGDRLTPAIVQWSSDQCMVGRSALLEQARNFSTTIIRTKQLLNEEITDDELESLRGEVPYRIVRTGNNLKYELMLDGRQQQVFVREIALSIFKKLHSIGAMSVGGGAELHAVITVPSYYSQKSINSVREVAEKAGFNVVQVIDEASAAVLATIPDTKQGTCLVLRIGGVSMDATVLEIQEGLYTIKSSVHKPNFGGRYITERLRDFLASEFKRQFKGEEISHRGKFKLETEAEKAKLILSKQNTVQCSVESVGGGMDLSCSVSRPRLDNIVNGLVPKMKDTISETLLQASTTAEQVEIVILCGGTMKIPMIQEQVRGIFTNAKLIGGQNSDEIIAIGAATHARFALKAGVALPNTLSMEVPDLKAIRVEKRMDEINDIDPIKKEAAVSIAMSNLRVEAKS